MRPLLNFNNKNIIVAGVGGIGQATVLELASMGANIIMIDANEQALNETIFKLGQGKHSTHICDFSKVDTIEPLIKNIVKESGAIDAFVYCVGFGAVRPLKLSKYEFMRTVMDINFFSFIEMIRCISLKGNYNPKETNIVGISAIGAFLGNSTKTAYCASKGAMNAAVRCLAKELAPKNIRINTVAPGVTDTPMARASEDYGSESEEYKSILQRQYLGICSPNDITNAVVFLLSNMSNKITGSCLSVDGGKLSS